MKENIYVDRGCVGRGWFFRLLCRILGHQESEVINGSYHDLLRNPSSHLARFVGCDRCYVVVRTYFPGTKIPNDRQS